MKILLFKFWKQSWFPMVEPTFRFMLFSILESFETTKGEEISKAIFIETLLPKKQTNSLKDSCPSF